MYVCISFMEKKNRVKVVTKSVLFLTKFGVLAVSKSRLVLFLGWFLLSMGAYVNLQRIMGKTPVWKT